MHDTEDSASNPNGGLKQYVVRCAEDEKFLLLYVIYKLRLIKGKSIVFVGDIDRCYRVRLFLEQFGIRACVLNSELPVNSRLHIVQEFNKNVYDIIIATDENEVLGDEPDDDGDEEITTDKTEVEVEVEDAESDTEIPNTLTAPLPKKHKTDKNKKQARKADRPKRKRDKEYGVSRGIDFHNVSCVLNFDLPTTSRSYTHRIGRTARAGKAGMALSFIIPTELFGKHKPTSFLRCKDDEKVLRRIQRHQRKCAGLPLVKKPSKEDGEVDVEGAPLNTPVVDDIIKPYIFDMTQANAFRYRMTDALRAVTKLKIREARLNELRSELVKSEKLKRWFEENPGELKALRHDVGTGGSGVRMPHLKHVPDYLLPKTVVVREGDGKSEGVVGAGGVRFRKETENRIRRARLKKKGAGNGGKGAKGGRDPLKTFKGKR